MANQEQKDPYPFSFMVLTFLAFIIIATFAKHRMNDNAAWGRGACFVAVTVAARSRWELRKKGWFWAALCVGSALQLPLIFMMPWAAPHLTGFGAFAFVIPGFLMALECVFIAEKLFLHSTGPK